jgi:SAM-dependent methyltransferase
VLGPKDRFSSRVEDYIRYRPFYPRELMTLLEDECGLTPDWIVADVGVGPGNLARLFLGNGNRVIGIEPNRDMREAGERLLCRHSNYENRDGCAEETGLPAASVDCIVAGQAFHWFDQVASKAEFRRILKPGGWVVLVWNMRRNDGSSFLRKYEDFLRSLPEYEKVKADGAPIEELARFFAPSPMQQATFANSQRLDLESFLGRVFSSSYTPFPNTPEGQAMSGDLTRLFEEESADGAVEFLYDTQVYFGMMEVNG